MPEQWNHPDNRHCYCYERNGNVYTSVYSKRQIIKGLLWKAQNRSEGMKELNRRLRTHFEALDGIPTAKQGNNKPMLTVAVKAFWQNYVKARLEYSTGKHYKSVFKIYLDFDCSLAETDTLKANIDRHIQNRRGMVGNTKLRKDMQCLRKLFSYCQNEGWIDMNPINTNAIPPEDKVDVLIFTESEMNLLLRHTYRNPFMSLFIRTAYLTAMRIQELVDLKWSDVSTEYFTIHGKGKRDRIFPFFFAPELSSIFLQLKKLRYEKVEPDTLFCWSNQQNPRLLFNMAKDFYNIDKAKTFHCIRKTVLSRWESAGIPIEVRTKLAGNSVVVQYKNYIKNPDTDWYKNQLKNSEIILPSYSDYPKNIVEIVTD